MPTCADPPYRLQQFPMRYDGVRDVAGEGLRHFGFTVLYATAGNSGVRYRGVPFAACPWLTVRPNAGRMSENGGHHANQRRKLALERCCQLFVRYLPLNL